MSGSSDGGQNALGGFFYQLLGSGAEAVEVLGGAAPQVAGDDLRVEYSLENLGQDSTTALQSHGVKTISLGQYKYSATPRERLIGGAELIAIAESFIKSETAAREKNYSHVEYHLVTNRELENSAEQLLIGALDDDDPGWVSRKPPKRRRTDRRLRHTKQGWKAIRAVFKSLERRTLREDDTR